MKKRDKIQKSLIEHLQINNSREALEILKGAGEEDLFEKAHQVGDVHPNGKWVWCQLPNGKFDWRTMNGRIHKRGGGASNTNQPASQQTNKPAQQSQKPKNNGWQNNESEGVAIGDFNGNPLFVSSEDYKKGISMHTTGYYVEQTKDKRYVVCRAEMMQSGWSGNLNKTQGFKTKDEAIKEAKRLATYKPAKKISKDQADLIFKKLKSPKNTEFKKSVEKVCKDILVKKFNTDKWDVSSDGRKRTKNEYEYMMKEVLNNMTENENNELFSDEEIKKHGVSSDGKKTKIRPVNTGQNGPEPKPKKTNKTDGNKKLSKLDKFNKWTKLVEDNIDKFTDYQYSEDAEEAGISKEVAAAFDKILYGNAKTEIFDWAAADAADEWKDKMEKRGYKVIDVTPGSDTTSYYAFKKPADDKKD
jgi:hypothetical protein